MNHKGPTQSPTPALPQREGEADKIKRRKKSNGSAPSLWG